MSFDFKHDMHKKIHFIGIGGISMSGLAEILLERGYKVSGSDMKSSPITDKLKNSGCEIYIGHSENNIKDVDLVVYTAAIPEENPELIISKKYNLPMYTRAEFLGQIMKGHKYNVAISGTHGKTTTTSMISHITLKENLDPTILVGGELDIINGNVKTGNSDYFITEACEYKASFLQFYPYVGVVLNIDADHLDFYKDIDEIQETFAKFVNLIPKNGYLIANAEDKRVMEIASDAKCNVLTFGLNSGIIRGKNVCFNHKGCATFDVYNEDTLLFKVELNVPGIHNVLNALASIACALSLGVSVESIIKGLSSFGGTHRRFELKGVKDGITVIDDYAHHPTEIKAFLAAAQNYPHKNIFCIFQPHTYSRTITLFDEFTGAFGNADELILAPIYAAREKDTGIVSSDALGDSIRKTGLKCTNFNDFSEIVSYIDKVAKKDDLVLTVGAGDIFKVGEMLLQK